LVVNLTGCFAIGLAGAALSPAPSDAWLFIVTGVLGSYTTVSSFSLQSVALLQRSPARAALYVGASALGCIGACALGYFIAGSA
ncbi:MAG: CrcB family protein, partial [Terricaulis silvestris]